MKATVLKPGLLSTFQDLGRPGFQGLGIPVSGAMDTVAARVANYLVGNDDNSAVLELTYGNFELLSETDLLISCCGGGVTAFVNGAALTLWKTWFIPAASTLTLKSASEGCRCYIAIAGGWEAEEVLNSTSTYLPVSIGGLEGEALQKGSRIKSKREFSYRSAVIMNQLQSAIVNIPSWGVDAQQIAHYGSTTIKVLAGHEFDWFESNSQSLFFKETFTLDRQSNRMGYQLKGPALILTQSRQLLSSAVSMGAIQVTPSGLMILLMADCQTTGGYPRIAQVISTDLCLCAQMKPGDRITFERVSIEDAEEQYLQRERILSEIRNTIDLKFEIAAF